MGDVLTLIEQAEQVFDAEQAEAAAAKIGSGELTLEDFLEQMLAIRKMGPIGNLLGMLPGAGQMKDALAAGRRQPTRPGAGHHPRHDARRSGPTRRSSTRRAGCASPTAPGVTVSEVNQLVDRFFEARKMMSSMARPDGHARHRPQVGYPQGAKEQGQEGQEGRHGVRRRRRCRSPLGAGMPGMPADSPTCRRCPKGLDELPPGLADFDLSKLKFPGNPGRK